jgi:hypothetical protein
VPPGQVAEHCFGELSQPYHSIPPKTRSDFPGAPPSPCAVIFEELSGSLRSLRILSAAPLGQMEGYLGGSWT